MSFIKKSTSAIGKFIMVLVLAATFLVGLVSVVYMSLQGEEIKVPEIVGKNFDESEKELALLGLRVKKRADRFSEEPPNTILEQLPKPGDTVKTGQMILVVTSKATSDGTETPMTIQKSNKTDTDDTEKIEELIDDKPKKASNKANTANKKKATTTRDVIGNNSKTSNTGTTNTKTDNNDNDESSNSNKTTSPANKPVPINRPGNTTTVRPQPTRTVEGGGDTRPRRTP